MSYAQARQMLSVLVDRVIPQLNSLAKRNPPEALRQCEHLRQGDVVGVRSIVLQVPGGLPLRVETRLGAVVLTQTCDLVQEDRPNAQLAPLVELNPAEAKAARNGRSARYVHVVREDSDQFFADLAYVSTIGKNELLKLPLLSALSEDNDRIVQEFGRRIGRRFSRFPFPDDVSPWIEPLKRVMQEKAANQESPLGRALENVREFRLARINGGWNKPGKHRLKLLVIMKSGVMPALELIEPGDVLEAEGWAASRSPAQIAARIEDESSAGKAGALWEEFGKSLARLCRPKASAAEDVKLAVEDVTSEVVGENEITYDRILTSAEVDLEHLSPPRPLG